MYIPLLILSHIWTHIYTHTHKHTDWNTHNQWMYNVSEAIDCYNKFIFLTHDEFLFVFGTTDIRVDRKFLLPGADRCGRIRHASWECIRIRIYRLADLLPTFFTASALTILLIRAILSVRIFDISIVVWRLSGKP